MNTIPYISLISLFFIWGINISYAQNTINKEVEVVKPYIPVVSDASKINSLPVFNDTMVIKPTFNYHIVPTVINTEYQLNAINPAKMVSMPLTKLYNNYLKLGLGNYGTPMAEFYMNSQRSKKYAAGLFLHHQSSGGKIKLENGKKVFAGYADNEATVFGKKFFDKSFLYGDARISGNTVYHYGYKPELDTSLEKGDIRQKYFTVAINAGLRSSHNDSSDLSYHFGFGYQYTRNRFSQSEGDLRLFAEGSKLYKNNLVGLKTSLLVLKPNDKLDTMGYANSIFSLQPFIVLTSPEYRLEGGLNLIFENQYGELKFYMYPDAELSINIAKDVLVGFVGLKGQIREHSYRSIAEENPFIRPDLKVRNTLASASIFGGLRGSLGANASFIAKAEFTQFKYDYFFVNDTSTELQNQFAVVYDNTQRFNLYLETNYDYSQSLSFALKANYNNYHLDKEAYAWNRPNFDLTFSTKYNLRNKILVNLDVISIGKRYAKLYDKVENKKELPGIVDFNIGLEYRYTKILSAWLKVNNLTASKYYMWNNYPTQGLNLMVGITYSL
jgi:uncharacterized protein YxeA